VADSCDIGGIRRINSEFGVQVGNSIIYQIGAYLNSITKTGACAFHVVGMRFLIVANNEDTYRSILTKLKTRFAAPWKTDGLEISLSATIRYFEEQSFFKSPEEIINLFDIAYSLTTYDGWGNTSAIGHDLFTVLQRQTKIERAIRQALDSGNGLSLEFQPMYSVSEGQYTSAEVLLRLNTYEMGLLSPSEFIPVAEKTGLIYRIDELVVSMTNDFLCRHPELKKLGLKHLEINLSAANFRILTAY
jgi:predicted signal transduction protein with EAL and GGDEF domain